MPKHKIAVVIPCYRVTRHIEKVMQDIPDCVDTIYCVDDACPDHSGIFITENIKDKRVSVLTHTHNQGVGGAVITGYKQALKEGADIIVKIDGDGQMNPALLPDFITPIIDQKSDYTKGNRFYNIEDVRKMPSIRLFGNAVLSFMAKFSTGYWMIFDPTNGYTAIHANALKELPLDKLSKRYFFESDLLFRLGTIRAVVRDVPMQAVYEEEESHLRIKKILFPFLKGHVKNFMKRIFYNYFLRDFSIASIEIILGPALLVFGIIFGVSQWSQSLDTGIPASAGTVMLSALPIILGVQLILSFLQYDIRSAPRICHYANKAIRET